MSTNDIYTNEEDTRFTLRIETDLLDKVKSQAKLHKRSVAKEIAFIIEENFQNNNII